MRRADRHGDGRVPRALTRHRGMVARGGHVVPRDLRDLARAEGGASHASPRGARRGGHARDIARPPLRALDRARGVPHLRGRARGAHGTRGVASSPRRRTALRVLAPVSGRHGEGPGRRPGPPGSLAAATPATHGPLPRDADPLHDGRGDRGRARPSVPHAGGLVPRPRRRLRGSDPDRGSLPRAARALPGGEGRLVPGRDLRRDRRALETSAV